MSNPFPEQLQDELERLEKEPFNEEIKTTIRKFVNDLRIKNNISEIRRYFYVQRLRVLARYIPDSFLDPKKKDIEIILENLYNGGRIYKDWTIKNYVTMLKRFYKWYYKSQEKQLPEYIADLNVRMTIKSKTPDDMITIEEVKLLIENAKNARDKAFFSVLYDSGCRLGELLNMRIKDLSFDEFGGLLKVTGKTGFRQVRIVGNSIAYLRAWLDNHPQRNDPNAYLFCNLSERIRGRSLTYTDVYSIMKKTAERAGIKKRIHPHLFRHTRATLLASKVTEAPLEAQMGWVHGSKQTRTYVHLSLRDQDNAILKAYGVQVPEDNTIKEDRPKECPRCHTLNPSDAKYCRNCWMPLTLEKALEMQEKQNEIMNAVKSSDAIDEQIKKIMEELPEHVKTEFFTALMRIILKDPVLHKKFLKEIKINEQD
ncbi:MAG: tyrosine-type recombinase/integrase [Thermoplasmata archaeon]